MAIADASDNLRSFLTDGAALSFALSGLTFRKAEDLVATWIAPPGTRTTLLAAIDYNLAGDFQAGAATFTSAGAALPAGTLEVERLTRPRNDLALNDSQNLNSHVVETEGFDDLARQIGDSFAHLSRRLAKIEIQAPSDLHSIVKDGAVPGGIIDNTAVINTAWLAAIAGGWRPYVPEGDYLAQGVIVNFHSVKPWGPGRILRVENGKTYAWEVTPGYNDTNTLFAMKGAADTNDGLSPLFPLPSPAQALQIFVQRPVEQSQGACTIEILTGNNPEKYVRFTATGGQTVFPVTSYRLSPGTSADLRVRRVRDGFGIKRLTLGTDFTVVDNGVLGFTLTLLAGATVGDQIQIVMPVIFTDMTMSASEWRGVGGGLTIEGPNPEPLSPTGGINCHPLIQFDGRISSYSVTTVGATTHFPLPFPIYPGAKRVLRIFIGGAEIAVIDDDVAGGDLTTTGVTIATGALTNGVYLTPAVDFQVAVPNATLVTFEYAWDTGLAAARVSVLYLRHLHWLRFSTHNVSAPNSYVYPDNCWSTGSLMGFASHVHSYWDWLGGVIEEAQSMAVRELFGVVHNTNRAAKLDAYGNIDLAASRARGLILQNNPLVNFKAKEDVTGHLNYTQILDGGVPFDFSRNSKANMTGVRVWRNQGPEVVLRHGSHIGGGYGSTTLADFGYGTANKNIRPPDFDATSGFLTNETSNPIDIDMSIGMGARRKEFRATFPSAVTGFGSWPFSTSDTSASPGVLVCLFASIPPGSFRRPSTRDEYEVHGRKTGANAIASLFYYLDGAIRYQLDIPAAATWFKATWKLMSAGPSSQIIFGYMESNTGKTRIANATLALALEDTAQRLTGLRCRSGHASDTLFIDSADSLTTDRRVPETAE
jgi:hypothetical protein